MDGQTDSHSVFNSSRQSDHLLYIYITPYLFRLVLGDRSNMLQEYKNNCFLRIGQRCMHCKLCNKIYGKTKYNNIRFLAVFQIFSIGWKDEFFTVSKNIQVHSYLSTYVYPHPN